MTIIHSPEHIDKFYSGMLEKEEFQPQNRLPIERQSIHELQRYAVGEWYTVYVNSLCEDSSVRHIIHCFYHVAEEIHQGNIRTLYSNIEEEVSK